MEITTHLSNVSDQLGYISNSSVNITANVSNPSSVDLIKALNLPFTSGHEVLFKVLMYIIASSAFLLNVCVFYILVNNNKSGKLQLTLLASLSFSDLIIALLSVIYYDVCFFNVWRSMDICVEYSSGQVESVVRWILGAIYTASQCAGLLVIYAITIDVLCAVCRPLYYRHCKLHSKQRSVIVCIWIISLTFIAVECLFSYLFLIAQKAVHLFYYFSLIKDLIMIFSVFSFFTIFLLYCIIVCKICCHVKRSPSTQTRSMRKSIITTLLIIGTYFVCMMPYVWIFLIFWLSLTGSVAYRVNIVKTFHLLYVLNTLMDPLIYAFRVQEVRRNFKKIYSTCLSKLHRRSDLELIHL